MVDSVLVPEGQKNLEELVVEPLAQLRKAHSRQPQFPRSSRVLRRPTYALSPSQARDPKLRCRCPRKSEKRTSFHLSVLLSVLNETSLISWPDERAFSYRPPLPRHESLSVRSPWA